jgi:hypothetical protein
VHLLDEESRLAPSLVGEEVCWLRFVAQRKPSSNWFRSSFIFQPKKNRFSILETKYSEKKNLKGDLEEGRRNKRWVWKYQVIELKVI